MSTPIESPPLPAALPHAHVLTYITGQTTAPRVRAVVTWGLRIVGAIHLLTFLALAYAAEKDIRNALTRPWFVPTTFKRRLFDALLESSPLLIITLLSLGIALTLLLCAGPAGRGRLAAAACSLLALIPGTFAILLLGAGCAGGAIMTGILDRTPNYAALFLFLPTLLSILAALLLKDLAAYTLWAARNSLADKPPTAFLPKISHRPIPPPPQSL